MIIPRLIPILSLCFAAVIAVRAQTEPAAVPEPDADLVKDAGKQAIDSALAGLFAQAGLPKRFAILPVQNDVQDGYLNLQLRNAFAASGSVKGIELYTRNDAEWQQLLGEIEWAQHYADTMDAETVQKFGKIKGVEALLVARVTGVRQIAHPQDRDKADVQVRFNVQAFRVETGQMLWGTESVGIVPVPEAARTPIDYVEGLTPRQWAWIGGGALAFFILLAVAGRVRAAARPR